MMGVGGSCVGHSNGHSLWGEDDKKDIVTDRAEQLALKLQVAVVVASYRGWRSDLPPSPQTLLGVW